MAVQINYSNSTVQDDGTLSNDVYIKGGCVSTDSKPTNNIAVGSELIEADTGKTYMYSGTAWVEQPSSGGGGSSNKFIVTLTPTAEDFSGVMDKTVAEINAAYEAGMEIWFTFADFTAPCAVVVAGTVYPHFFANVFDLRSNTLMVAYTYNDTDGTDTSYGVAVYSLTPLS